jgi:hypothetical protein
VCSQQLRGCTQRDFFRWIKLPVEISSIRVPLLLDAGRSTLRQQNAPHESLESIAAVLPSDMLCALHDAGPEAPSN